MTIPKPTEDWEKEFDKMCDNYEPPNMCGSEGLEGEIKTFIKSILSSKEKEAYERGRSEFKFKDGGKTMMEIYVEERNTIFLEAAKQKIKDEARTHLLDEIEGKVGGMKDTGGPFENEWRKNMQDGYNIAIEEILKLTSSLREDTMK